MSGLLKVVKLTLSNKAVTFFVYVHVGAPTGMDLGIAKAVQCSDQMLKRYRYTRKNAQVAVDLQTSCNKSVHKLLTRCIRTACSEFVGTSLEQAIDKL